MSLALLAVATLAWLVEGGCPSRAIPVVIGSTTVPVRLIELQEGEAVELPCGDLLKGYAGLLRVFCLAGVQTTRHTCEPKSCPAGQRAPARIGDSADLLPAETRGLAHNKQESIPCRILKEGYLGHVHLRCFLGELRADAASCHPQLEGARSAYRLLSGNFLPGTWRVFELYFYSSPDCQGGKLFGELFGASELAGTLALSADRNISTFWSAWCPRGCTEDTAWLALALPQPDVVRCVLLQQSEVSCCRAEQVHLDVWDGEGWQRAHTWDVRGSGQAELVVPVSCGGLPGGVGLVDDCDGLPIVGLKEGETCTASCTEGYVGGAQELVCQGDGQLAGSIPSCIDVARYTQISVYVLAGGMLLVLGCVYSCVCMVGKGRLTFDVSDLPEPFQGRWLESKGVTSWELISLNAQKQKAEAAAQNARAAGFTMPSPEEGKLKQPRQAEMSSNSTFFARRRTSKKQGVDGLCSPCEDPDLCVAYALCPFCRQADTWHTLGVPQWQTYWKVLAAYVLCPWCFPCLNFYGRYRIRQAFGIPLEPHRDCCVHCLCCCCCTPCAHLQEARLVDAPVLYYRCKHKLAFFHIREAQLKAEKAAAELAEL